MAQKPPSPSPKPAPKSPSNSKSDPKDSMYLKIKVQRLCDSLDGEADQIKINQLLKKLENKDVKDKK